jgi:hypothetical protein
MHEDVWKYEANGFMSGPYTAPELARLIAANKVLTEADVVHENGWPLKAQNSNSFIGNAEQVTILDGTPNVTDEAGQISRALAVTSQVQPEMSTAAWNGRDKSVQISWDDVKLIARYQRIADVGLLVIGGVLFPLAATLICLFSQVENIATAREASGVAGLFTALRFIFLIFLSGFCTAFQVFLTVRFASAMKMRQVWLWGIRAALPGIGMIALYKASRAATTVLQNCGVRVGLLGAFPPDSPVTKKPRNNDEQFRLPGSPRINVTTRPIPSLLSRFFWSIARIVLLLFGLYMLFAITVAQATS